MTLISAELPSHASDRWEQNLLARNPMYVRKRRLHVARRCVVGLMGQHDSERQHERSVCRSASPGHYRHQVRNRTLHANQWGPIGRQKRVFRAAPGGKTDTLSGHISARRGALPMCVMWPLDSDQPRTLLQFDDSDDNVIVLAVRPWRTRKRSA